jgi:hypothetical protein
MERATQDDLAEISSVFGDLRYEELEACGQRTGGPLMDLRSTVSRQVISTPRLTARARGSKSCREASTYSGRVSYQAR